MWHRWLWTTEMIKICIYLLECWMLQMFSVQHSERTTNSGIACHVWWRGNAQYTEKWNESDVCGAIAINVIQCHFYGISINRLQEQTNSFCSWFDRVPNNWPRIAIKLRAHKNWMAAAQQKMPLTRNQHSTLGVFFLFLDEQQTDRSYAFGHSIFVFFQFAKKENGPLYPYTICNTMENKQQFDIIFPWINFRTSSYIRVQSIYSIYQWP